MYNTQKENISKEKKFNITRFLFLKLIDFYSTKKSIYNNAYF